MMRSSKDAMGAHPRLPQTERLVHSRRPISRTGGQPGTFRERVRHLFARLCRGVALEGKVEEVTHPVGGAIPQRAPILHHGAAMPRPRERDGPLAVRNDERGAIRVLLVDDDPVARASLRTALAGFDGIEVAGDCPSGWQTLDQIEAEGADVIILDSQPSSGTLAHLCRSLNAYRPSIGVLLLGAMEREGQLGLAIDIADGLILKATPVAELVQGIRNVYRGRPAVDRRLWPALFCDDIEGRGAHSMPDSPTHNQDALGFPHPDEREMAADRIRRVSMGKRVRLRETSTVGLDGGTGDVSGSGDTIVDSGEQVM